MTHELRFAGFYRGLEEVGCAIVARPDFTEVNAKVDERDKGLARDHGWFIGGTALHFAAAQGHARLCRAIIERPDFHELRARWSGFKDAETSAASMF